MTDQWIRGALDGHDIAHHHQSLYGPFFARFGLRTELSLLEGDDEYTRGKRAVIKAALSKLEE